MKREDFVKVAEDALDSLPEEFRSRIHNVAILVEDFPPNQSPPRPGHQARLLLGVFPCRFRAVRTELHRKDCKTCHLLRCMLLKLRLAGDSSPT